MALRIRGRVLKERATIYDDRKLDEIQEIAASLNVDARIHSELIEAFSKWGTFAALGADAALKTGGLIALATELVTIQLKSKERFVPGKVGAINVFRSHLEWPGSSWYEGRN